MWNPGSVLGWEDPGEEVSNQLQYSSQENPWVGGPWKRLTVHGLPRVGPRLSDFTCLVLMDFGCLPIVYLKSFKTYSNFVGIYQRHKYIISGQLEVKMW